jgi:hypothetical protein
MACPTIADAPWFGVEQCSGHGVCNNLTNLCTCFPGYSGGADLFEQRISPTGESLDCGVSLLGITIVWSITLAFALFRQLCSVISLIMHVRIRAKQHAALQVLCLDVFINHPGFISFIILKAYYGQVIGTDVAITVLFALMVPMTFFTINHFSVHQFRVIQANGESDLFKRYRSSAYAAPILYFLFASVPTLCSLGITKQIGPVASGEIVILIFRILCVCIFQLIGLKNAISFAREAEGLLHSPHAGSDGSSTRAKVMKIIDYMNNQANALKKKCVILLLLHIPFLTPYLWQQQGMLIGISITLISLSNPALSLLRMQWATRKNDPTHATSSSIHLENKLGEHKPSEGSDSRGKAVINPEM